MTDLQAPHLLALEARDKVMERPLKNAIEELENENQSLRSQLASARKTLEEPVAWRWRMKGSAYWDYAHEEPQGPSVHLFEVQPLYAITDSK